MDNYIKLKEKLLYKKPVSDNAENRYWHSFNTVLEKQHNEAIKSIHASNNQKNRIAIAHHNIVEIFNTNKNQVTQNLSRFKSEVLNVQLRSDSQLLATSHEDGFISIMNLKTKTYLRQFKNFKKPVHSICFNNLDQLYAACDDGTIKLFDIPNDTILRSIPEAHSDFIRAIQNYQNNQILTSSYDNTIKLFDLRNSNNTPIKIYQTQHPVEALLILPNNQNFVSAQGEFTTLWDFRKEKLIQELQTNQQTVTSLTLSQYQNQSRVISGSLDHQIKYIRTDVFSVTHQEKWKSPILSLDSTSDGQNLAIGGNDGHIQIHQLKTTTKNDNDVEEEDEEFIPDFLKQNPHLQRKIKNYKFYNRGIYSKLGAHDFLVPHAQHTKFTGYDKFLVSFQYKEAMLKAFKEKQSAMIVSLYEEFQERGALQVAFKKLDEEELNMMIEFILQKISNPKFSTVMLSILENLVDMYNIGDIYQNVKEELDVQRELAIIKGMIAN